MLAAWVVNAFLCLKLLILYMYVYGWVPSPEIITTLLISYTPVQNKKFFKKASLKDIWILFHSLTKSEEHAFFEYWKARESKSCSVVSSSLRHHGLYSPWHSPGQNTGVGSLSLLQGIFPTQGLNPGLPHCRGNLYQVNHQGRPRILERVAYPFSSGSSQPRNRRGLLHCRWILYQLSGKPRKHISFLFF